MATSTYDYFFKLPGELREQILTSLLVKPEGVRIHDLSCSDLMRSKRPEPRTKPRLWHDVVLRRTYVVGEEFALWPLSYFLVSRAFHREASAAYFSRNMFYLYSRKRYRPPPVGTSALLPKRRSRGRDRDREGGPAQEEPNRYSYLGSLRRVRRAVLQVRSMEDGLVPLLREMALAGGLRHLDVMLWDTVVGKSARAWDDVWRTDPGMWLSRLLRDPDVNAARLQFHFRAKLAEHGVDVWCLRGGSGAPGRTGAVVGSESTAAVGHEGTLVTGRKRRQKTFVWRDLDIEELARMYCSLTEVGMSETGEERSLTGGLRAE